MRLIDLGERRVVAEVLSRYVSELGDDCAIISSPGSELAITTDPVPEPAATLIGGDPDPYWRGWLLVIINASDLAAAGASPLAFLAAIECPPDLEVHAFERFLSGVADACTSMRLRYVGGNLREASKFAAVGTAIGYCSDGTHLGRAGAKPRDLVVSIGAGGIFWRDALKILGGETIGNREESPLFRPLAKTKPMELLAQKRLITAAQDNSDGLLPTLQQLAERSRLGIELELDALKVSDSALDIDPARLWLGWGDWNVIATIHEEHFDGVKALCHMVSTELVLIGRCSTEEEAGRVFVRRNSRRQLAPRLESERFAHDSWFVKGIQAYVNELKGVPLP